MAKRAIRPEDMFLFLSDGATPDVWQPVMCLTQNAVNIAVADINSNTLCGSGSTPGQVTIEVPFQGEGFVDLDVPGVSISELQAIAISREVKRWKISPVEPKENDEIHTFEGYLSQADKSMQVDNPVTFTCNIKVDTTTYDAQPFNETT